MRASTSRKERLFSFSLLLGAMTLLAGSTTLILSHVEVVRSVKDVSVPLIAELPVLERRLDVLKEQVELAEVHEALEVGSLGEKMHVYVLPESTDVDRIIRTVDALGRSLDRALLTTPFVDVSIGDTQALQRSSVAGRMLTFSFAAREEGIDRVLSLIHLGGLLTVGDVLEDNEVQLLFQSSEEENPASIVALEQFLSLDLLAYVQDARSFEDRLRRSFASPAFTATLDGVLQTSRLREARRLLEGDFGRLLSEERLWPTQMMVLDEIHMERGSAAGWYKVDLSVLLLERRG